MNHHRPCGACRELVPADTGCEHWKPGGRTKRVPALRTAGAGRPASVTEFQRTMGRDYR